MYMYDVYPLKFGFERGSGTENHGFYYGSFGHLPSKIVKIRNRHPGVKITPFLNLKKGRSKAWQSAAFDKTDFLFLFSFLKKTIKTKKLF